MYMFIDKMTVQIHVPGTIWESGVVVVPSEGRSASSGSCPSWKSYMGESETPVISISSISSTPLLVRVTHFTEALFLMPEHQEATPALRQVRESNIDTQISKMIHSALANLLSAKSCSDRHIHRMIQSISWNGSMRHLPSETPPSFSKTLSLRTDCNFNIPHSRSVASSSPSPFLPSAPPR